MEKQMLIAPTEKICTVCNEEFVTVRSQQHYCSYDCYVKAARSRSRDYYKKVREAGAPLEKICPTCHEQFATPKMRVKYCSHACYYEATKEKNRAYAQMLRDKYKAEHPKSYKRECELCGSEYDYRTKQGKYCEGCKPLGYTLMKGMGPVNVPSLYKDLPTGATLAPSRIKCFICGKPAASADTPCEECNK